MVSDALHLSLGASWRWTKVFGLYGRGYIEPWIQNLTVEAETQPDPATQISTFTCACSPKVEFPGPACQTPSVRSGAVAATLTSMGFAFWACSTSTSMVQSEYDLDARFAAYETFAIAEDSGQLNLMATDGYQMAVANEVLAPDLDQMARATVVESLEKKNMTLTESVQEADVVVTYFINLGASPEVLAPDYRVDSWSSADELGKKPVTRGMLVVDVLDPAVGPKGRSYLVWRGWVENSVDLEEKEAGPRGARLTQALRRILERYPQ